MRTSILFIHGVGKGAHAEDGLLVDSLREALGSAGRVRYPEMVDEEEPTYAQWEAQIESELAALDGDIVLVGHSIGASVLLKLLSEGRVERSVRGLFLIAAPYWGEEKPWRWDEVRLPGDAAARLGGVPHVFFYHSRDDETVPFDHLARYAALFPSATIREVESGGHQLGNDLGGVAEDIQGLGAV